MQLQSIKKHCFILMRLIAILLITANYAHGTLPKFNDITPISQKKLAFFAFLTPLAQKANAELLLERKTLLTIKNSEKLSAQQKQLLKIFAVKYKVNLKKNQSINDLLRKVDIIPTSLL